MKFDKEDLERALQTLKKGGIILYPTDTVWGIGCDATNKEAIEKIFALKKRKDSKSMLVLVDSFPSLERTVKDIPDIAYELIEVSEHPLTIIYDQPVNVAANLPAEDGSLGVRITNEEFSKELCRRFRKPIVSTSANISGTPSPSSFQEISEEIKNDVDYIVEYGRNNNRADKPSNIIKVSEGGVVKVIR